MSRDVSSIKGLRIGEDKITLYLLNPDHPRGGSKAKFLIGFGFEAGAPRVLQDAVAEHFLKAPDAATIVEPDGGYKIVCEGPLSGPDGRAPSIRSVWKLDRDGFADLVTVVPLARGKPRPAS